VRAVIDREVVSRVLAERHEDGKTHLAKSQHDREGCLVADVLRVIHKVHIGSGVGWAVSKTDNRCFAYHGSAPE